MTMRLWSQQGSRCSEGSLDFPTPMPVCAPERLKPSPSPPKATGHSDAKEAEQGLLNELPAARPAGFGALRELQHDSCRAGMPLGIDQLTLQLACRLAEARGGSITQMVGPSAIGISSLLGLGARHLAPWLPRSMSLPIPGQGGRSLCLSLGAQYVQGMPSASVHLGMAKPCLGSPQAAVYMGATRDSSGFMVTLDLAEACLRGWLGINATASTMLTSECFARGVPGPQQGTGASHMVVVGRFKHKSAWTLRGKIRWGGQVGLGGQYRQSGSRSEETRCRSRQTPATALALEEDYNGPRRRLWSHLAVLIWGSAWHGQPGPSLRDWAQMAQDDELVQMRQQLRRHMPGARVGLDMLFGANLSSQGWQQIYDQVALRRTGPEHIRLMLLAQAVAAEDEGTSLGIGLHRAALRVQSEALFYIFDLNFMTKAGRDLMAHLVPPLVGGAAAPLRRPAELRRAVETAPFPPKKVPALRRVAWGTCRASSDRMGTEMRLPVLSSVMQGAAAVGDFVQEAQERWQGVANGRSFHVQVRKVSQRLETADAGRVDWRCRVERHVRSQRRPLVRRRPNEASHQTVELSIQFSCQLERGGVAARDKYLVMPWEQVGQPHAPPEGAVSLGAVQDLQRQLACSLTLSPVHLDALLAAPAPPAPGAAETDPRWLGFNLNLSPEAQVALMDLRQRIWAAAAPSSAGPIGRRESLSDQIEAFFLAVQGDPSSAASRTAIRLACLFALSLYMVRLDLPPHRWEVMTHSKLYNETGEAAHQLLSLLAQPAVDRETLLGQTASRVVQVAVAMQRMAHAQVLLPADARIRYVRQELIEQRQAAATLGLKLVGEAYQQLAKRLEKELLPVPVAAYGLLGAVRRRRALQAMAPALAEARAILVATKWASPASTTLPQAGVADSLDRAARVVAQALGTAGPAVPATTRFGRSWPGLRRSLSAAYRLLAPTWIRLAGIWEGLLARWGGSLRATEPGMGGR